MIKKTILDYKLLEGSKKDLTREILSYTKKGWDLQGGTTFTYKSSNLTKYYCQAIVLKEEEDTKEVEYI